MGQRGSSCAGGQPSAGISGFSSTTEVSESKSADIMGHNFNASTYDQLFIGISGLIGAGKSTLATALGKEMGLPVYYEPVADNEYLADFYTDMHKYSFPMQIYLLNKRFRQQQQIVWQGSGGVQDRTIYEDSVFARMLHDSGHIQERDFKTYMDLFQTVSNLLKRPDIIVHLDVTPEESYHRIQLRKRDCESGVPLDYLKALHAAYEVFIADIARVIPVIRVDYSRFRTAEEMAVVVKQEYSKIANIRRVTWGEQGCTTPVKRKPNRSDAETATPSSDVSTLSTP